MQKEKTLGTRNFFKIFKWAFLVLAGLFIILIIIRVFYFFNLDKTNAQIAKIHATKLSLDDVLGKNLPPDPGSEADKTVQGIDANKNGIRDDVELVIFNAHPNSAKTRAVLLQYALALQMETTQSVVNTDTATEVVREEDRAGYCLSDTLVPRESLESSRSDTDMEKINKFINFIENKQFDTKERKDARNNFLNNLRSYSDLDRACDIDVSNLLN